MKLGKSDIVIADILWSYYATNSAFEKMATVLSAMANSTNDEYELDLERRMEYLSRAIAAAKSSRPGANVEYGHLLHDLEESSEVAEIQRDILAILRNDDEINPELVQMLDYRLLTISELYNEYASPLGMHEVVLSILHTSGHKDRQLMENTWTYLLQRGIPLVFSPASCGSRPWARSLWGFGRAYLPTGEKVLPRRKRISHM